MWLARRSSRFSRSSWASRCVSPVVVPARVPPSTSACRTQLRNVSGCIPSWLATRTIAPDLVAGSCLSSTAIRVARSRSSSPYFFGAAITLILHGLRASTEPGMLLTSMTSKPVAQLMVDLGVARSHSRPHVSNDNPYSEAAFKTLKYAPAFPQRFGSLADARGFGQRFFSYYNHEHRHCGIGLHTPASVHFGTVTEIRAQRQHTLNTAYTAHPERFGNRRPQPPQLPTAAWINQPSQEARIQTA